MANKHFAELAGKDDAELRTELRDVRRVLFGLRVSLANQASENTANVRKLRRTVARIKTLLRQREMGAQPVQPAQAEEASQS